MLRVSRAPLGQEEQLAYKVLLVQLVHRGQLAQLEQPAHKESKESQERWAPKALLELLAQQARKGFKDQPALKVLLAQME